MFLVTDKNMTFSLNIHDLTRLLSVHKLFYDTFTYYQLYDETMPGCTSDHSTYK